MHTIWFMIPLSWHAPLYTLLRLGLALAFLVAGALKLRDPLVFALTVDAFGILPGVLVLPVAYVLPTVEILGAVALLLDIRGALGLITGMLGMFVLVLGYGLHMGLDIDCGCYGPADPEAAAFAGIRTALLRDGVMLGCVAALYCCRVLLGRKPLSVRDWFRSVQPLFKERLP